MKEELNEKMKQQLDYFNSNNILFIDQYNSKFRDEVKRSVSTLEDLFLNYKKQLDPFEIAKVSELKSLSEETRSGFESVFSELNILETFKIHSEKDINNFKVILSASFQKVDSIYKKYV